MPRHWHGKSKHCWGEIPHTRNISQYRRGWVGRDYRIAGGGPARASPGPQGRTMTGPRLRPSPARTQPRHRHKLPGC